jgi:hypothetical protein
VRFINPKTNCGVLHSEDILRKDEESETKGCGLSADFCLKYQNKKMLRLDCVRKGEKLWVLSKIRKTV